MLFHHYPALPSPISPITLLDSASSLIKSEKPLLSNSVGVGVLAGTALFNYHKIVFRELKNCWEYSHFKFPLKDIKKKVLNAIHVFAEEPSLCYRYEGDGVCEDFEKESIITDCGLHTPEGYLDQWASQAYSYHEDKEKCPVSLVTGEPHSMVS